MFFDRDMEIFDDGAGIETPVTLGLRFNRFMERGQTGTCSCFNNQAVEVSIQIEDTSCMAASPVRDSKQLVVDDSELGGQLRAQRFSQLGSSAPRDTFKPANDQVELIRIFLRQRGNDHARLADMTLLEDV